MSPRLVTAALFVAAVAVTIVDAAMLAAGLR